MFGIILIVSFCIDVTFKIIQIKISVRYVLNCPELFRLKESSFPKAKLRKTGKTHMFKGSILIWIKSRYLKESLQ